MIQENDFASMSITASGNDLWINIEINKLQKFLNHKFMCEAQHQYVEYNVHKARYFIHDFN
jgi:hypothetical protein